MHAHNPSRPARHLLSLAALAALAGLAGCATTGTPGSAAAATPAAAASGATAAAKPDPSAPKPFADVIKDAKQTEGFIPVWRKDDKVWLELGRRPYRQAHAADHRRARVGG